MNFNLTIDKRLQAVIHKKTCINCGKCSEICPTGAVAEFQKTLSCSEYFREDKKKSLEYSCSAGCPFGIVPQAVASLIKSGNTVAATQLITERNPMPQTVAQICDETCMSVCKRGKLLDAPLNMCALEKYIFSNYTPTENRYTNKYRQKIAVIGAGPAGLGAALELRSKGYSVTVFEKDSVAGGAMRWGIPDFRLDKKLMKEEIDKILDSGIELRTGIHIGRDLTMDEMRSEGFAACLIAAGASYGVLPEIPGADGPMVYDMVTIMRYLNHAVEANETEPRIGNRAVVSGREGLALDVARSLIRRGIEVNIVTSRREENLTLSKDDYEISVAEGIRYKFGMTLNQIIREGDVVKAVELVTEDGSKTNFFCDTVVLAEEQVSRPMEMINAETHPDGKIKINNEYRTNKEMIFACGDITGESDSVAGAIAEGQRAARHIDNALQRRILPEDNHGIFSAPDEEILYCNNIPMYYPQEEKRIVGLMDGEENEYIEEVIPILRTAGIEENMPAFKTNTAKRGKKVAVIGGGISGITAAVVLAKKGYEPVIIEKTCRLGGRYTWLSSHRRLDKELLEAELQKVEESGIKVIYNTSAGVFPTFEELLRNDFDAVLLAIGETIGKRPDLENVYCNGVFDAVSLMGRLAHDEIVEGLGKKVMVTGADEMAIDMARQLKRHCDEVTILAPCSRGGMRIMASQMDMIIQEGINIVTGVKLTKINQSSDALQSIDCKILDKGLTLNIPCDTLVLGETQAPDTEAMSIRNLGLDIDEDGYPVIDDKLATSVKNVFAIGNFDMSSSDAGKAGAAAVDNYLSGTGMYISILPMKNKEVSSSHEIIEGSKVTLRGMEKARKPFSRRQALTESSRCMNCGYHKENINKCIGCGICMKMCPVGAIDMLALKEK